MRWDKTPYCSLNSQPPKLTVHYTTDKLNLLDTYQWALGGPGESSITQQPWLNSCLCLHTHAHIPHTLNTWECPTNACAHGHTHTPACIPRHTLSDDSIPPTYVPYIPPHAPHSGCPSVYIPSFFFRFWSPVTARRSWMYYSQTWTVCAVACRSLPHLGFICLGHNGCGRCLKAGFSAWQGSKERVTGRRRDGIGGDVQALETALTWPCRGFSMLSHQQPQQAEVSLS